MFSLVLTLPIVLIASAPIAPGHLDVCFRGPFRGITAMTIEGEPVGEPDLGDWGCLGEGAGNGHGIRGGRVAPEGPRSGASGVEPATPGVAGTTGVSGPSPVEDVPTEPPHAFCFGPAFPNPADVGTRIRITVPRAARVQLQVYGQSHRLGVFRLSPVRTLFQRDLVPGIHEVLWDLKDDQGARVAPGIYRAVLRVEDQTLCGDIEVR